MKCILEHIKSQTVPHLFIEELVASGVVFYEGNYTPLDGPEVC